MNHWLKRKRIKNTLINVGSVVKDLRTGTLMTVSSISTLGSPAGVYTVYFCQWFVGTRLYDGHFAEHQISLEKP